MVVLDQPRQLPDGSLCVPIQPRGRVSGFASRRADAFREPRGWHHRVLCLGALPPGWVDADVLRDFPGLSTSEAPRREEDSSQALNHTGSGAEPMNEESYKAML